MAVTAARQVRDPLPDFEIDSRDVEYLSHESGALQARLLVPRGPGPFPMVVDLHGGAWCNGDRLNDLAILEPLARSGVVVAALDFRMPPTAGYPASLADVHYGIRWLKARAQTLRGRADRVGLIGISSGGHQAMLLAMRPEDPRYGAVPHAGGIDARVQGVILCWPVIDPLGRYHRALELQAGGGSYPEAIDRVIPLHRQFWPDEEAMSEGSPTRALERGEPAELPPVLYLQGTADQMHPRPHLDRFVTEFRKRGGDLDLALYDGEVEGFINRKPGTPNAVAATQRIIDFVHTRMV